MAELNDTDLINDANLEAYYRYEGNFNDSSGEGRNGSGNDSPASLNPGKFGQAYDWDGDNDNVQSTITGETPFASAWTMTCWVKPDSSGEGSGSDNGYIMALEGKSFIQIANVDGSTFKLKFVQAFSGANGSWSTDNFVLSTGSWQMVTVVYNGSSVNNNPIIYVNGISRSITETATPSGSVETSTTFNVGNNQNTGVRTFDGGIDDVALFSRALTQSEISLLADTVGGLTMAGEI